MKRELASVSAQDEFSKWAKLRRQHDKVVAEHDKSGKNERWNQLRAQALIKYSSSDSGDKGQVRLHREHSSMALYNRTSLPTAVLVFEAAALLDTARMGSRIR